MPDDNAILYLTSGATGEPKMVMVTHGALVANVHMGPAVLPLTPDDITVAFLPSAHIAQRVVVELLPILSGAAVSFVESLLHLPGEIKSVRPTWFLAPPRVWERIYTSIRTEIQKKPPLAQKAFFGALALGLARGPLQAPGQARSAAHPASARPRAPAHLRQNPRALRRTIARGRVGRGAAGRRSGGILRSGRHAADRRLWAHRRRRGGAQSA